MGFSFSHKASHDSTSDASFQAHTTPEQLTSSLDSQRWSACCQAGCCGAAREHQEYQINTSCLGFVDLQAQALICGLCQTKIQCILRIYITAPLLSINLSTLQECVYTCVYIYTLYIIHMKHDVALENDDITQAHPTDSFWFMCDDLIHSALTGLHGGPVW